MTIQIPKANRFEPQQSQSVGRMDLQAPNVAAINQPQTTAIQNLAQEGVKYIQKQEDNAIDTAAKAASIEYNVYLNNELAKARNQKGNPDQIYSQFDEASQKGYEEILNKNPDLSSRGKEAVRAKLYEVMQDYKMKRDTAQQSQYYDYDLGLTKDSTKLDGQEILTIASYVDPANPTSFATLKPKIDAKIAKIAQTWKTHGGKFGQNVKDEYDNEVPNDSIKVEVAKSISDALVPTIDYLNRSGHPEIAEQIYGEYSRYIDSYKKDTVKKSIADQQQLIKALNIVPTLIGKKPAQVDAILDREFKDDPIGKEKAYAALSSRINKQQNIEGSIAADAYASSYRKLSSVMSSKNPYKNWFDVEQDPDIGPQLANMTPRQIDALKKAVNTPTISKPGVFNAFLAMFQTNKLKGMSPEALNEMQAGMNKEDRGRSFRLWEKFNSPQTTAEEIRQYNFMSSKLIPSLQAAGYIRKVERFTDYGPYTQERITNAQRELMDELEKYGPMSVEKQMDVMREFAAKKAKGETLQEPEYKVEPIVDGASLGNVQTLEDRNKPAPTKPKIDRPQAIREFYRLNNKRVGTPEEIDAFMKKMNGE